MSKLPIVIGQQIRLLRKSQKLSIENLAKIAKIHASYLGQIERGEKNITIESLHKILISLDISLSEFFYSIDPMFDLNAKSPLSQIVSRLLQCSDDELLIILKVVDLMFDWKEI